MNIQAQSPQHATPPESFTSPPLTPPPTEEKTTSSASRIIKRIIREIGDLQQGRSSTDVPWAGYTLDPEGYQELLDQLQSDDSLWGFVEDKLRYDYFPSANQFVLRMPTIVHERFIAQIVEEIQVQLKSVTGESAHFANKIGSYGSASITFPDQDYGKHDPDAQFHHSDAPYAAVVLEVSYAQKRKDLARLADDYILGSDSDIRVVIGLDIEYRGSKKATVSVWRPNVITNDVGEKELVAEQIVTNQVFRHSNGDPGKSPIGGLQLRLRDFTTVALAEGRLRDPIDISAATLCTFLEHAEERASFIKRQSSVVPSAKPWTRKRRREATPPEELRRMDEKRFRTDENKVEDQATKDDSSYKTGSTSGVESS